MAGHQQTSVACAAKALLAEYTTLYTKLRRSSGEHVIRQTGSIRTCRAGHEGQHWLWQHVHSAYDQANLHTRLACVCAQSTP